MKNQESPIRFGCGTGGFSGLLTIAFIVLKLCHVIEWSWLWVLAPIWINMIVSLSVIILLILITVFITT